MSKPSSSSRYRMDMGDDDDAREQLLESSNNESHSRLATKSAYLKSLALNMETEAKQHNLLLDDVSQDADSLGVFMSNSLSRVSNLLRMKKGNGGQRQLMCYVVVAVLVFCLVLRILVAKVVAAEHQQI